MTAEAEDWDPEIDALRERVAAIVEDWDGVEPATMFGLPSFTAHGSCSVSSPNRGSR